MKTKNYTTATAGRACEVSPRTVAKWFDAGLLRGYRLPGGDRRIPAVELRAFMLRQGIPLGELALGSAGQGAAGVRSGHDGRVDD